MPRAGTAKRIATTGIIMVSDARFSLIEAGEVEVVRCPVDPPPRLIRDRQYSLGGECWHRDDIRVTHFKSGIPVVLQCDALNRGRLVITRASNPKSKPILAVYTDCLLCRLMTDIAEGDSCDVAGDDLQAEGYWSICDYARDWNSVYGRGDKGPFVWWRNPFVWRIMLRVLTREIDGESGRSRAGKWQRGETSDRRKADWSALE